MLKHMELGVSILTFILPVLLELGHLSRRLSFKKPKLQIS